MPAGLQVFNDSGTIQIDDTYRNLMLINKFSVPFEYANPTFQFNVNGTVSIIAYTWGGIGFPVNIDSSLSGTVWTYRWNSFWPTSHLGGVNDTMNVFVFGDAPGVAQNEGLQVFNGSGQMMYQSAGQPMRFDYVGAGNTNFTGPSGRTYAVALLRPSALTISLVRYTWFPTPSGNTVTAQLIQTPGFGSEGTNSSVDAVGLYAAVNVTGY